MTAFDDAVTALKTRGKEIRHVAPNLTSAQCLELAAREAGYKTYAAFRAAQKAAVTPTNQ